MSTKRSRGRPKKLDFEKKRYKSISVPERVYRIYAKEAQRRGVSLGSLIVDGLTKGFSEITINQEDEGTDF